MKKIKNKFILVVILFVISILGIEIYKTFIVSDVDRNSYVILINWEATLNNSNLQIDKKELLKKQDKIKTIWEESLAMIKWWDWSITRVGWDSSLIINQADVENDLLNIKISFNLEKWKTWSDVISFIGKDSYFHQTFADTTAAVRGTTFEVNLEKDYIYVNRHEVKLINTNWDQKIITENNPFNISTFSFIDLNKFLKNIKDSAWQKLNIKLDEEFYKNLLKSYNKIKNNTLKKQEELEESINNISDLTIEKKQELYAEALSEYQKLNFISTWDKKNYINKLKLKEIVIKLSPEKDKENLLITTLYDFKDLAQNDQFTELTRVAWILWENNEYLPKLNINLWEYIDFNVLNSIEIPEGLKQEFNNNFNEIIDIIDIDDNWFINSTKETLDDLKENFNKLRDIIN